jgi:hypothetical protein
VGGYEGSGGSGCLLDWLKRFGVYDSSVVNFRIWLRCEDGAHGSFQDRGVRFASGKRGSRGFE